jgi:hypothetical protein
LSTNIRDFYEGLYELKEIAFLSKKNEKCAILQLLGNRRDVWNVVKIAGAFRVLINEKCHLPQK